MDRYRPCRTINIRSRHVNPTPQIFARGSTIYTRSDEERCTDEYMSLTYLLARGHGRGHRLALQNRAAARN